MLIRSRTRGTVPKILERMGSPMHGTTFISLVSYTLIPKNKAKNLKIESPSNHETSSSLETVIPEVPEHGEVSDAQGTIFVSIKV